MTTAFFYAQMKNITTTISYPYVETTNECEHFNEQTTFSLTSPIVLPGGDEIALKAAVATYGPITAAVDATLDSFFSYSSGVYYDRNCSHWLTHASEF